MLAIQENRFHFFFASIAIATALLLSSCGKDETTGTVIGAGAGTAIGAAVGNNATGAAIGGLAGALLGSTLGRASDDEDREVQSEMRERAHAREKAIQNHKINNLEHENRKLKQKWCSKCSRQVTLTQATSCPSCGGALIHERYCRECLATFSPSSGYRYCPYCPPGTALRAR
jgi:hypothetical protein